MALEDILAEVLDGTRPLSNALTRALVSAQQEGYDDLAAWLRVELFHLDHRPQTI